MNEWRNAMVYPRVNDEVVVPKDVPSGTLFVTVSNSYSEEKGASLEDCARGFWTKGNLAAAKAKECTYLAATRKGRILRIWKIDTAKGWVHPAQSPMKTRTMTSDDVEKFVCEIVEEKELTAKLHMKAVRLGRTPNPIRGYFAD